MNPKFLVAIAAVVGAVAGALLNSWYNSSSRPQLEQENLLAAIENLLQKRAALSSENDANQNNLDRDRISSDFWVSRRNTYPLYSEIKDLSTEVVDRLKAAILDIKSNPKANDVQNKKRQVLDELKSILSDSSSTLTAVYLYAYYCEHIDSASEKNRALIALKNSVNTLWLKTIPEVLKSEIDTVSKDRKTKIFLVLKYFLKQDKATIEAYVTNYGKSIIDSKILWLALFLNRNAESSNVFLQIAHETETRLILSIIHCQQFVAQPTENIRNSVIEYCRNEKLSKDDFIARFCIALDVKGVVHKTNVIDSEFWRNVDIPNPTTDSQSSRTTPASQEQKAENAPKLAQYDPDPRFFSIHAANLNELKNVIRNGISLKATSNLVMN